jgi:hypothetical protein
MHEEQEVAGAISGFFRSFGILSSIKWRMKFWKDARKDEIDKK